MKKSNLDMAEKLRIFLESKILNTTKEKKS